MNGARRALVFLSVSAAVAAGFTTFFVIPTADGVWHGLADPPGMLLLTLAGVVGLLTAWLLDRHSEPARALCLLLALAPILPAATGYFPGLLLFQGPILLLLASLALGAIVAERASFSKRQLEALARPSVLLLAGFAAFAGIGSFIPGPAGPQGDEPHYLTMTQSLLSDLDLDLTDEFRNREYASFFPGELRAHASPGSPAGALYSIHAPGLPVLLLPGYALLGYPGAKLTMSALAALAAAIAALAVRRFTESAGLAVAAWLVLVLTPPLPFFAVAIYPEVPAALATALFLWRTSGAKVPDWTIAAAASALPWIHPKFLPLSLVGVAVVVIPASDWARRARAVIPLVASLAALLVFYDATYGAASLSAAYGAGFRDDVTPLRALWGAPALLLDRQFGLLATSPVWALALPGALTLARASRPGLAWALALGGSTFLVGASFSMWWGGASAPARFVVPALPALALCLAWVARERRALFGALVGCGACAVALAAYAPRAIHNRPNGASGLLRFLSPTLDLDPALPSYLIGGGWALVLSISLVAALALAWAYGPRGALAGSVAFLALGAAGRDTPLVDARGATLRLAEVWDGDNLVGPPLRLDALRIPVDMREPPWSLEQGVVFASRRIDLPPGAYRVDVAADVIEAIPTAHVAAVTAAADAHVLARHHVQEGAPPLQFNLAAPVGLRRLSFLGSGVQGRTRIDRIAIVPRALVPRRLRNGFGWPRRLSDTTYRAERDGVRVTVLDDALPEGRGFRLRGEACRFVVEAGAATELTLRIETGSPERGDYVAWPARRERLERRGVVELRVPPEQRIDLSDSTLLPLELRSRRALIVISGRDPG